MKWINLVFTFYLLSCFAQVDEIRNPLMSNGEIPEFIKENQSNYFLAEKKKWIKGSKSDKDHYLNEIYSSNMIVFGDLASTYCTELLKLTSNFKQQVYVVRSTRRATFSNSAGDIFITIGILSNLTSEQELLYFLFREMEVISRKIEIPKIKKFKGESTIENLISKLSSFSFEDECVLDQKAWEKLNAYEEVELKVLNSCFTILLNENAPFYEKKLDWNYFLSEKVYIPSNEFFNLQPLQPRIYKPELEFPLIALRKKNILGDFQENSDKFKKSKFLLNQESFLKMLEIVQQEEIFLRNQQVDFYMALYEIYTMEVNGFNSPFLDLMKAFAWAGIIKEKRNEIEPKKYVPYFFSDNEGSIFCRFIRKQNTEALASLALRYVKDLQIKNPNNPTFKLILEDLTRVAANLSTFNIELFTKSTYQQLLSKHKELLDSIKDINVNLIDKKTQYELSKSIDSFSFHLYILPDLMSDNKFIADFHSFKRQDSVIISSDKRKINSLNLHSFEFKKYRWNKEKNSASSIEEFPNSLKEVSTLTKVAIDFNFKTTFTVAEYNKKFIINSTILQAYNFGNYEKKIIPILSNLLIDEKSSEIYGIALYRNEYKPKLKAFHLTSFLIVTLPYVVPEFFLSGNRTLFASFYFDARTGQIEGKTIKRFRDPYNKFALKNCVFQSINDNFLGL